MTPKPNPYRLLSVKPYLQSMPTARKKDNPSPLRFPANMELAAQAHAAWDSRNGRYYVSANVLTKLGWLIVTFDFDSRLAVEVDGRPIQDQHVGLGILGITVTSINGKTIPTSGERAREGEYPQST
jgi:hypothetical protein